MITNITNEKSYKISYFKPASKVSYGFSVEVVGDKKSKVIKESKELLAEAERMLASKHQPVAKPEESEGVENVHPTNEHQ